MESATRGHWHAPWLQAHWAGAGGALNSAEVWPTEDRDCHPKLPRSPYLASFESKVGIGDIEVGFESLGWN